MREARLGHYFFSLSTVTFTMPSNCEEPLVAIEVAKHWVGVAVLAERHVCGCREVGSALADSVKFTE